MPDIPSRTSLSEVADYLDERSKHISMLGATACRAVAHHLREVMKRADAVEPVE